MPEFKDAEGRKWAVNININDVLRVRKECNIDITADDFFEAAGPLEQYACLIEVLRPQIQQKKISEEDFGQAFYGDAAGDAFDALRAAIVNFTPNKHRREMMLKALDKQDEVEKKMFELAQLKLDQQVLKVEQKALMELDSKLDEITNGSIFSNSSPNAPQSVESTQVHLPSES